MSSNEEKEKEKDGLVSLYLHFTHTFNSNIFIGLSRGDFLIIDKKGNVLKEVEITFEDPYNIVVANDTIYITKWTENKIVCLDTKRKRKRWLSFTLSTFYTFLYINTSPVSVVIINSPNMSL
jgi:outer membrane protein assembly factor BamB